MIKANINTRRVINNMISTTHDKSEYKYKKVINNMISTTHDKSE